MNLYDYVGNNPINAIDPLGLYNSISSPSGPVGPGSGLANPAFFLPPLFTGGSGYILNRVIMDQIVQNAMNQVGSLDWATAVRYKKYGPGVDKCNIFPAEMSRSAGAIVPNTSGSTWLTQLFPMNPPTPGQWADKNFDIPNWPFIQNPVPGAMESSGGHLGIIGPDGHSSISVYHGGEIINNNWGFSPGDSPSRSGPYLYRGYTGP